MKNIIILSAMLFLQNFSFAQTSIGFKNPQNIQPLLDYRLPSWGYSYFNINFSSRGSGDKKNTQNFQLYLRPGVTKYYESEENIWNLSFSPGYSYQYSKYSDINENSFNYRLNGYWHKYVNPWLFLGIGNNSGGYLGTGDIDKDINKSRFNSHTYISLGFGRVRNVGPIIRALRINERLQRLKIVNELSADKIQQIAQVLFKHGGYVTIHDRYDKYFWQDLFQHITPVNKKLSAFDYYYIGESLIENIGERYNGCDLEFRLDHDYANHNYLTDSLDYSESNAGFSVKSRWYKNLSLSHQIGLTAQVAYTFSIDNKKLDYEYRNFYIDANNLWVINDRLLWETAFYGRISFIKTNKYHHHYDSYLLRSSFDYFIEDNLLLDSNIDVQFYPKNDEIYWTFNIGFVYYISRNLF